MPRSARSRRRPRCGARAPSSFLLHARGIEHHSNGVQNTLGTINLVLAVGPHRPAALRLRHHRRPGQRPGRARARPEVRSAARAGATSPIPSTAATSPSVWGIDEAELPGPGRRCLRDVPEDRRRRDQGPDLDLLQPEGVAARQHVRDALPREARVLRRDRLLPQRHRAPRRHRAARQPARGGRRHGHAGRRPHHQGQQGGRLSGRGAPGLAHHPGHRARRSAGRKASRSPSRARSSRSCASRARAASPTTRASPTKRSSARWACSGRATADDPQTGEPIADHPGTPRLFEPGSYNPIAKGAGPFYFPDGKRPLQRRRLPRAGGRCERASIRSS